MKYVSPDSMFQCQAYRLVRQSRKHGRVGDTAMVYMVHGTSDVSDRRTLYHSTNWNKHVTAEPVLKLSEHLQIQAIFVNSLSLLLPRALPLSLPFSLPSFLTLCLPFFHCVTISLTHFLVIYSPVGDDESSFPSFAIKAYNSFQV